MKTVLVEVCLLGQKLYTQPQRTPLPLVFNEKLQYKKEFDKGITFCCLADLMKASTVQVSLMEVKLSNECRASRFKCVCCARIQLSSFLFPPPHITKYQSAKLFPHKNFKPVLKFWVDAVIYRSSAHCLTSKLPDLKYRRLVEELKRHCGSLQHRCDAASASQGCSKQTKKSRSCLSLKIRGTSPCHSHCHVSKSFCGNGSDKEDEDCGGDDDVRICASRKESKKSLKRRVDFWLSRLHQLSFKPADEFSCLLRSIYNRQYSEALLRYNRFSRPSLPSCLPVRSCAPL